MTNEQIIAEIASSIYGEDVVNDMLQSGEDIPLHTVKGWALRGPFRVKQGQHGIEVRLWKKRKRKNNTPEEEEYREDAMNKDFYMAKAFLFTREQVEVVTEKEVQRG